MAVNRPQTGRQGSAGYGAGRSVFLNRLLAAEWRFLERNDIALHVRNAMVADRNRRWSAGPYPDHQRTGTATMAKGGVSQRRYDLQRANHLYRRVAPFGYDVCSYCGDPATTDDHVLPVSFVASLGDAAPMMLAKYRSGLVITPACSDCNVRLGRFMGKSIEHKRRELKVRLRKKYWRLVGQCEWTDEELAALGYSLRRYIDKFENKRRWIMQRLTFPSVMDRMFEE